MSDSTRRHNAVSLQSLQQFALANKLATVPIFGKLEKPRMGERQRIPTDDEIKRLLDGAPARFRLIFTALSQTGCRPAELCGLKVEDVAIEGGGGLAFKPVIELARHNTARKTGKPRLIPIGRKFAEAALAGDRGTGRPAPGVPECPRPSLDARQPRDRVPPAAG